MKIEMELWHLILLLLAFFGCVAGFSKVFLTQLETRLKERFVAQDKARQEGQMVVLDEDDGSLGLRLAEYGFARRHCAMPSVSTQRRNARTLSLCRHWSATS